MGNRRVDKSAYRHNGGGETAAGSLLACTPRAGQGVRECGMALGASPLPPRARRLRPRSGGAALENAARSAPGCPRSAAPAPIWRIALGTAVPPAGVRVRDGSPHRTVASPNAFPPSPPARGSLLPRRSAAAAARGDRRLAGGLGSLPRPCCAQMSAAGVLGAAAPPECTGRRPA